MTLDSSKSGASGHDADDKDVERIDLLFDSVRSLHQQLGPFLSTEGIFIAADKPREPSTVIRFRIIVGGDFDLFEGTGVVVWTRSRRLGADMPAGMALRYVTLGPQSEATIAEMVAKHVADGGEPFDIEPQTDPGIRKAPLAGMGFGAHQDSNAAAPPSEKPKPASISGEQEPERVRLKVRSAPPIQSPEPPSGRSLELEAPDGKSYATPEGVEGASQVTGPLVSLPTDAAPVAEDGPTSGDRQPKVDPPSVIQPEGPWVGSEEVDATPTDGGIRIDDPDAFVVVPPPSASEVVETETDELTQASPEFTLSFPDLGDEPDVRDTEGVPEELLDEAPVDVAIDLGIDPPSAETSPRRTVFLLTGLFVIAAVAALVLFLPWERWLGLASVAPFAQDQTAVEPTPVLDPVPIQSPSIRDFVAYDEGSAVGVADDPAEPPANPLEQRTAVDAAVSEPDRQIEESIGLSVATRILSLEAEPLPGATLVRLVADGSMESVAYSIAQLDSPPRILLQLADLDYGLSDYTLTVDSEHVVTIRSWVHDETFPSELHVVLDLSGAEVQVVSHEKDDDELRFILR